MSATIQPASALQDISVTNAAVGVIQRENGLVLLGERPTGKPWAGYWEFPGGKVESGETPAKALVRELQEELGISPTLYYPWITRTYNYPAKYTVDSVLESPAKTVKLHFFVVVEWLGEPLGLELQALSWQNPERLTIGPMLPANAPIMAALCLPPIYAISNLSELGEDLFFLRLRQALGDGLQLLQVREKHLSPQALMQFVEQVVTVAKPYGAKVFVNGNVEVALKLGATGVHFTSRQLMDLHVKPQGILSGASCHNQQELAHAAKLGLDYAVLSPVQITLSHADANPLGWNSFNTLIQDYPIPVFALGGMQLQDLHTARLHGAHGIAMQRAAWKE
jgi:8-oxo-dGTP diphosphatase